MMENLKDYRVEYFLLFVGVSVLVVLMYIYRFNKDALILLSGLGSIFYIFWGIIHHWIRGKLTKNIAYEYFLFGFLSFLLFFTVLSI